MKKLILIGLCILLLIIFSGSINMIQQEGQKVIKLMGYDLYGRPIFIEGSYEAGWHIHPDSPGTFKNLERSTLIE